MEYINGSVLGFFQRSKSNCSKEYARMSFPFLPNKNNDRNRLNVSFRWECAVLKNHWKIKRGGGCRDIQLLTLKLFRNFTKFWSKSTSSRLEVFCKKGVLRNFTKFTGKHLCHSLFFNKVAGSACNFIKKETLAQVFFCEFSKISSNIFSYRTPLLQIENC